MKDLMRIWSGFIFFASFLLVTTASQAKTLFPEAEVIDFYSVHSTQSRSDIVRKRPALHQPIFGYFFKAEGTDRAPTVVYAHSSNGLYRRLLSQWIVPLTNSGYNVFVVDSFTSRGIGTTTADQTQLFDYTMVVDALRGLHAIASRPDVDKDRVAILGGSKGGIVAYETLYQEYRDAAQIGQIAFKIHIPLYPTCNWNDWSSNYTEGSIVAFLGGADDFTPASLCIEHFKKMIMVGARVSWKMYDGFHHGFDNGQGVRFWGNAATSRNCGVYVDLKDLVVKRRVDDTVINDPGAHYSSCNERGAHSGGTTEQAGRVRTDVLEVLRERL